MRFLWQTLMVMAFIAMALGVFIPRFRGRSSIGLILVLGGAAIYMVAWFCWQAFR